MYKNKINRNKLVLNKNLRISFVVVISLLLIVLAISIVKVIWDKKEVEKKEVLFSYKQLGKVNYTVSLLPNDIFQETTMKEAETYITKYVDTINSEFNYEFQGDDESEISGNYEIVAVLKGSLGSEEESKTVWQKQYILQPKTDFKFNDKKATIKKKIPIRLNDYQEQVRIINNEAGIDFDTDFSVVCNVFIEAKTKHGTVKEKLSPRIDIPLNTNFFIIKGNPLEEKEGALEKTKTIQVPINRKIIFLLCLGIIVDLLCLFILLRYTIPKAQDNISVKKLRRIFKSYGDRIVKISTEDTFISDTKIKVLSISDLVKLSDDICKPILYIKINDPIDIYRFYVLDEENVYLYEFEDEKIGNIKKQDVQLNVANNEISEYITQ